jgi:RHS repeat-associated protein
MATRGGHVYRYGYDGNDRLATVTRDGVLWATYLYNGFGQLSARELTAATGIPGTAHYSYDRNGRLIAETDAATGATLREYIWLDNLPVAVIDGAGLYHVVTDHLYRPVALLDASGAQVWSAVWEPFGALHSVNGSIDLDARFPGQWYQLETGLHYNWHRHYDPTLGRFTQPDPIGLEAGANRFSYALANPIMNIDPDGKFAIAVPLAIPILEAIGGITVGVLAGSAIASAVNPPKGNNVPMDHPLPEICKNADSSTGEENHPPKNCDKQYEDDSEVCRYLPTKTMRAKCWTSAMERYSDCLAGRTPLPLRY